MTKAELLNVLRIAGLGENAVILAGNAFDLGAEAEREECAKICENEYIDFDWAHVEQHAAEICAESIRARGQE